jgi:hypothetical protein
LLTSNLVGFYEDIEHFLLKTQFNLCGRDLVVVLELLVNKNDHYEKFNMSKPHCPITKVQKTTCMQLLCNYTFGNTRK